MTSIRERILSVLKEHVNAMNTLLLTQLSLLEKQIWGDTSDKIKEEIKANEDIMDQLEVTVHDEAVEIIGLMSPRAGDLRFIIASLDMSKDIERIGDLIFSISPRLAFLINTNTIFESFHDDIISIFETASKMIQNVIFAYEREDNAIARNVIKTDENVDNLNNKIQEKLFSLKDNTEQYIIRNILEISRISYNIERIGDGATNLAEAIIFITEGKDIKHENKNISS